MGSATAARFLLLGSAALRDLKRLAEDLKPETPSAAAKPLDDAVRDATSPDAVIPALPPWMQERMKELLLETLERARRGQKSKAGILHRRGLSCAQGPSFCVMLHDEGNDGADAE